MVGLDPLFDPTINQLGVNPRSAVVYFLPALSYAQQGAGFRVVLKINTFVDKHCLLLFFKTGTMPGQVKILGIYFVSALYHGQPLGAGLGGFYFS
jgi:hypothetical protein